MSVPRIDLLPDRPTPYKLRDWRQTARNFDAVVFDQKAAGPYLPLVWRVPNAPNLDVPGFGIPSYVGKEEQRGKTGESIAAMGALLGGTMAGIDKRAYVELAPQYFNPSEGLVLNNAGARSGSSFWYELLPSIVFTQLSIKYPTWARGGTISRSIANSWIRGMDALNTDFDHTSLDFATMKPVDNKLWKEGDAAAAVAYLELLQGLRSGEARYITASRRALGFLQRHESNPTYEVLMPYGALAAAYLNAERDGGWDVPRFVDWSLDPTSPNRVGWGMVAGKWGGYDVGGLMGSTNDGGGYAFAMNTYLTAATLAPVARYDDRFSAPLAKWILNLTNAARLFYRDSLPEDHQSSFDWPGDRRNGIAYEALRRTWEGKAPYATGDAKRNDWAKEDLGLYGGGYVGLLGALVHSTNVPMILRIDLRATDFLPAKAYPTDLFWNPYDGPKTVNVDLGKTPVRPYDPVTNQFLSTTPVSGIFKLTLKAKQAVQVVRVPATGALTYSRNRTQVNGITIDANNGKVPLPARTVHTRTDESIQVPVSRAKLKDDGSVDWGALSSATIPLNGGEGSTMRADLRFAWDPTYLYFRIDQKAPATETIEAPSVAELQRHWWDFEDVVLNFDPGRERIPVANVPEITVAWNSNATTGMAFSPDLDPSDLEVKTYGKSASSTRQIEGRVAWSALNKAFGFRRPLDEIIRPGAQIGCQPLMVDGTFKRQAYIGGMRYTRPSGFDVNSRTLVLGDQ